MTNTDKKDEHIFVPTPNPEWNIKIANKDAVAEKYGSKDGDKDYGDVETGAVECCQKSCTKMPQTVCKECFEYVCEDHLYRHPNCNQGK